MEPRELLSPKQWPHARRRHRRIIHIVSSSLLMALWTSFRRVPGGGSAWTRQSLESWIPLKQQIFYGVPVYAQPCSGSFLTSVPKECPKQRLLPTEPMGREPWALLLRLRCPRRKHPQVPVQQSLEAMNKWLLAGDQGYEPNLVLTPNPCLVYRLPGPKAWSHWQTLGPAESHSRKSNKQVEHSSRSLTQPSRLSAGPAFTSVSPLSVYLNQKETLGFDPPHVPNM